MTDRERELVEALKMARWMLVGWGLEVAFKSKAVDLFDADLAKLDEVLRKVEPTPAAPPATA